MSKHVLRMVCGMIGTLVIATVAMAIDEEGLVNVLMGIAMFVCLIGFMYAIGVLIEGLLEMTEWWPK